MTTVEAKIVTDENEPQTQSEIDTVFSLLEEKISSRTLPYLKVNFGEKYHQLKKFTDLKKLLIEEAQGSSKLALIQLYNALFDLEPHTAKTVESFYIRYKEQLRRCERPLIGRETELNLLHEHMINEQVKVINIYGEAGIGKSLLVKWFLWRTMEFSYYADCRGVTECNHVIGKLLKEMEKSSIGNVEDLTSSLLTELKNRGETTIIAIDDITESDGEIPSQTTDEFQTRDSVEKLSISDLLQLILSLIKSHGKLKVVITTRKSLESEVKEMENSWKYLELIKISEEDCRKVVALEKQAENPVPEDRITSSDYNGNLLWLNLVVPFLQKVDEFPSLVSENEKSIDKLFSSVLGKLIGKADKEIADGADKEIADGDEKSTCQRLLETLSMFPGEVTIQDLYETHYLNEDSEKPDINKFWSQMVTGLYNNLLVDLVNVTAKNLLKIPSTVLKWHHNVIRTYMVSKLAVQKERRSTEVTKYIRYHISLMVNFGENSIKSFVQTSHEVNRRTASISSALHKPEFCDVLSDFLDRNIAHLVYFIIFLEIYQDLFQESMSLILNQLKKLNPIPSTFCCLTAYLSKNQRDFSTMNEQIHRFPVHLVTIAPPVFYLLSHHVVGYYYLNAPYLLESKNSALKGKKFLSDAQETILELKATEETEKLLPATRFFEVLVLLELSNFFMTHYLLDWESDTGSDNKCKKSRVLNACEQHVKEGLERILEAKRIIDEDGMIMLKDRMLLHLGLWSSYRGDSFELRENTEQGIPKKNYASLFEESETNYIEAECHMYAAEKVLMDTNREYSRQSARVKIEHAKVIMSHANLFGELIKVKIYLYKKDLREPQSRLTQLLIKSVGKAKEAQRILINFGDTALKEKLKVKIVLAQVYQRLVSEQLNMIDRPTLQRYANSALTHWNWVYNTLIKFCQVNYELLEESLINECRPKKTHLYLLEKERYPKKHIEEVKLGYKYLLDQAKQLKKSALASHDLEEDDDDESCQSSDGESPSEPPSEPPSLLTDTEFDYECTINVVQS